VARRQERHDQVVGVDAEVELEVLPSACSRIPIAPWNACWTSDDWLDPPP